MVAELEPRAAAATGHVSGELASPNEGGAAWRILRSGHAPPERLLVVGDALSDYDVGWVDLALDGPDAAATALASLQRLADLGPRVVLLGHGSLPADPAAAFATAVRRALRLVDDPAGAVWYGARRSSPTR